MWQGIESVASGLSFGNGEILGGLLTLLVSLAALRAGGLPKGLNILGLLIGAGGILSIIPRLTSLIGVFGAGQIIWFVWLGLCCCAVIRVIQWNNRASLRHRIN